MSFDYQTGTRTASVPDIDFSGVREMRKYDTDPKAMYIGAPGKYGYLRMGFELDSDGKSILRDLDRRVPLIVQQELYFDEEMPEMPCVYILSSSGQYMEGDRCQQDITVRENAFAFISTGAATKIAEMSENYAGLVQNITLEKNAYLEFLPEPNIPCRNARFVSDTRIVVDPSATMFYSEIYMPGRKHYHKGPEIFSFDILSVCCHAERPDGEKLFREKFIIEPDVWSPVTVGVMEKFHLFANVVVLTPEENAARIYEEARAYIDRDIPVAVGITHLPNKAGLLFKVLGMETGPVKKTIRDFCSLVRKEIKGHPLPEEFPWR